METEKWICVDYILKLNHHVSLREYPSLLSGLEKQVRGCYSEDIDMDSKEFLQMLLLDSCFILVYLGGMQGICRAKDTHEASVDGHGIQEDSDTVDGIIVLLCMTYCCWRIKFPSSLLGPFISCSLVIPWRLHHYLQVIFLNSWKAFFTISQKQSLRRIGQ
ncbi:Os05g0198100 [Oryza sativa Japonica Group]|uniref:Os05g0198100 protein n=1 Tax=Oryza sativa subsp. japonica TaxID=39947 RepID=A0A0P0WJ43_ORYSJ|nr:Os05g0198100 [Oryza sativa Japonica Group]